MEKVLYSQGIFSADFYDRANDSLISSFVNLTEGNLTTTVNLNPIKAGIGNPIIMQIPSDAELKLAVTAANLSQVGMSLNTGSTITPNGKYHVKETVTLDNSGKGTVTSEPTYDYGSTTLDVVGWIAGYPDTIAFTGKTFTVLGLANKTVCIEYVTSSYSAEQFRIGSIFAPKIVRAVLRAPLYTSEAQDTKHGIIWGNMFIVIPMAQLDGNLNINLSQTTPSNTLLNLTALADYGTDSAGGCASTDGTLGYVVYVPNQGDIFDGIKKLVVIGGGVEVNVGENEKIVVKGLTTGDTYENLPYERLNFVSASPSIATINNVNTDLPLKGTVTGVTVGDTKVTITALDADGAPISTLLPAFCDVEVI